MFLRTSDDCITKTAAIKRTWLPTTSNQIDISHCSRLLPLTVNCGYGRAPHPKSPRVPPALSFANAMLSNTELRSNGGFHALLAYHSCRLITRLVTKKNHWKLTSVRLTPSKICSRYGTITLDPFKRRTRSKTRNSVAKIALTFPEIFMGKSQK